ncbi:hypothetical protein BDD12DRAFT_740491, partial [Trichophaea hybrida]
MLSIIIDGLDKFEKQKLEFIRELHAFVIYLLERSLKPKVLLTSQPHADVKEILDGLPCIEYDKERKECLNTLRFENTRYDMILDQHECSLGWLWDHEKYQAWSSRDSSDLLLLEGKPGSGKSTLTKYFACNLLEQQPHAKQAIVTRFFYSYRELQMNHSDMLRSILYDVLMQNETFFCHYQHYYRQALQTGTHFQWPYNSLKRILHSFGGHPTQERLYLIIDAMDESNDKDRSDIIQLLSQLCSTTKSCIIKIFLASRPIARLNDIAPETRKITLQDMNGPDIKRFAESFLGPNLKLPQNIVNEATEYIVTNAEGVFIWVQLVRDELLKYAMTGCKKKEIFAFLRSLPIGLEEFYKRILEKLENRGPRDITDGAKMFRLVLFAFRPLRVEEIRHALAIPDDVHAEFFPTDQTFEDELIHGITERIIHCGGNFLEIKANMCTENNTVQVIHQTVREFFLRPNGLPAESKFNMSHVDVHARISITCLRYLMLCTINTSLESDFPSFDSWTLEHFKGYTKHLNDRPFIGYVLHHLKQHMDGC